MASARTTLLLVFSFVGKYVQFYHAITSFNELIVPGELILAIGILIQTQFFAGHALKKLSSVLLVCKDSLKFPFGYTRIRNPANRVILLHHVARD